MHGWNYRTVTLAERAVLLACGLCLGTAWAAEEPSDADALLQPPEQAVPERNVELRRRSEERANDPFDLPPPE